MDYRDYLNEKRIAELLEQGALTKAEEDEVWGLLKMKMKQKLRETEKTKTPVLTQAEINEFLNDAEMDFVTDATHRTGVDRGREM